MKKKYFPASGLLNSFVVTFFLLSCIGASVFSSASSDLLGTVTEQAGGLVVSGVTVSGGI